MFSSTTFVTFKKKKIEKILKRFFFQVKISIILLNFEKKSSNSLHKKIGQKKKKTWL
jgi:hypothetical protein